jgi:glycosyltransferase involved in cell wall biosynthesis
MGAFLRRAIIDQYGVDPNRVVHVGGGANLVAEGIESKRYDRQVALFVGDKFEIKGGETMLEAWHDVRSRLSSAELWIVGPKARQGPASRGIRWFGYVADRNQLAQLYREASVFVLPSHFEAWGHVFLEAMGHGLPCIGTDQLAMPEIIAHGDTGLIVPARDPHALAAALTELLSDPARARSMGLRAYREIAARGTWDHVVDRMAPHLDPAASGKRSDTQQ